MALDLIADYNNLTGEGPLWHPEAKRLFWVDIPAGKLFQYDPATGEHGLVYEGRPIGGYTLQADGNLLCFRDKGNVVVLDLHGNEVRTVIASIPDIETTRFNDVIAAPDGSVFAGSMTCDATAGILWHVKTDGNYSKVLTDQGTPNGMGFSPDENTFYYQDSRQQSLTAFDYDKASGEVSNPRVLRVAKEAGDRGRGDGMTVDAEGNIWSARYEGGCFLKASIDGVPQEHFDIPAHNVTCVTFAGENYDDIYITTAGGDDKAKNGEGAGALFKTNVGVKGKAEYRSRF